MRNYTKPSAEVVELAVKEPVSLVKETNKKSFGFGAKTSVNKFITYTKYAMSTTTNG